MTKLSEMKVSIGFAAIFGLVVAVAGAAFGWGVAYTSLSARVGALERDLGLRDSLSSEIRTVRDLIENEERQIRRRNDALHDTDITSIKLALVGADIPVEN